MQFKDHKPIFLQIAERICDEILGGKYPESQSGKHNSLLHGDKAIAAWRQSNCCIATKQSTKQYNSDNMKHKQ